MKSRRFGALALACAAGLAAVAACTQLEMPTADQGAALYQRNCAICHGDDGRGQGDIAPSLHPEPADLTLIAQRAGGSFPRAEVLSVMDGFDHPKLSGREMPEFGLLLEGDTVPMDVGDGRMTPVPRPLAALLLYLEQIQS